MPDSSRSFLQERHNTEADIGRVRPSDVTYTTSSMAERSTNPRVKLPDAMPLRHAVPGANSWAQQQQREQSGNPATNFINPTEPTNRDKYENKPMPPPPPPEDDPSHAAYTLKPKTYVPPAIPQSTPTLPVPNPKNRAVTDPVTPKPLFSGAKAKLRKQFSLSKGKAGSSKEGSVDASEDTTGIHVSSEKTSAVSGVNQKADSDDNTTPTSASYSYMSGPAPSQLSHEASRVATPAQQHQPSPVPTHGTPVLTRKTPVLARSTPVPTKRYLVENPHLALTEPSSMRQKTTNPGKQDEIQQSNTMQEHQLPGGSLRPARIGTHTNVGEVGLVEGAGMHRVESFRGVIEDAPASAGSNVSTNFNANASQPSTEQGQSIGGPVPPDVYSPSNYGGVWENDPAVGRTLPPFTPMRSGYSATGGTASHYNSPFAQQHPASHANLDQGNYPINNASNYQHTLPSANAWASNNSQGNSYAHTNVLLSGQLPPHWHHQQYANSVPSPPANVHDFQRTGSLTAAMAHMDLSMHHHIDSSFGSLSRQITNKHDFTMDQTIRQLDKIDNGLKKGFRDMKTELREIKNIVINTHNIVSSIQGETRQQYDGTMKSITDLDVKLQALDKHIDERINASELESDRQYRSETTSQTSRRRTESARPTFGQGESRSQDQGEASRSTTRAQASRTSSRRDHSNAPDAQRPAGRVSNERSHRREYFTELGAAMGPQPDLRDHPAYANRQQTQGQQAPGQTYTYRHDEEGDPAVLRQLPFQVPSLTDGKWFDQAYGRR